MITLEEVRNLRNQLEDDYRGRHEDFVKLRKFWHGKYWDLAIGEGGGSTISSIFRDLANRRADVGPDIKLIHNVLQEVCVKYQTYLGPLPQIRVYVDSPESEIRRAQATLKERYLYGLWSENNMVRVNNECAWYLPLMGDVFHGIFPDFDKNMPKVLLRSPECAWPVPTADGLSSGPVIFSWKVKQSTAVREFPSFRPSPPPKPTYGWFGRQPSEPADPDVWIYEYSDDTQFCRWVGDQRVAGVEHNFGFNLFEHMKFIDVPGEQWGHGAVEQIVGLVEMGNALHSLNFQAVLEHVFPRLVLINPAMAPEVIDNGPGAVIPINEGGDAKFLVPPTGQILAQANFGAENERMIKQGSSMPDVNFGNFNASIVTGKAINELQGAGTGSVVEMVQGTGIGPALVKWNEKAIAIAQTVFRDDKIELMGTRPSSMYSIAGHRFALSLKGKQIIGSNRNEVIFGPALNLHEKLVMNLQAMGAGLVSKKYSRDQQGIPDNAAMEEEIFGEQIEEAVLGFFLSQLQADPEGQAAPLEARATAFLEGGNAPVPHPLLGAQGAPPQVGAPPAAAAPTAGPPQAGSSPGAAAGGSPAPAAAAPPSNANVGFGNNPQTITIDQAVQRFTGLQGIAGRVWLMGEIVARGQTTDLIEVGLTDGNDRLTIRHQLHDWAGFLRFHHVRAQPTEPSVEVTPSAASQGAPAAAAAPGPQPVAA